MPLLAGKKNIGKNISELKADNKKSGKEKGAGGKERPLIVGKVDNPKFFEKQGLRRYTNGDDFIIKPSEIIDDLAPMDKFPDLTYNGRLKKAQEILRKTYN